ncbi:permease [Thermococcus chitonophagus]|uniref:Permease n=1 Tax=Thermococcus chitonophagus TaxID=54262 RepID=A0A161K9U3_9EURY|nr:MFS transporter [Thermococcus chitonophagus]ASJ16228.1 permease [Thermococcus chitonophagus]CUX78798.1 permease, putative [Thermococcus chitonophagus]
MKKLYQLHLLTSALRIIGDAIESVALPWSLLNSTSSLLSIGGFALFSHLPWVILPPILGRTLDRTKKKVRVAFLALLLQGVLVLVIIPLSSNLIAFYLIISGISALDILHRYYGLSLIASMTLKEEELQRLNSTLATVENVTSLVAFPIAGFLSLKLGIEAMAIDSLLLIIGALSLVPFLNLEVGKKRAESHETVKFNRKLVFGILTAVLVFNFALGSARIFIFSNLRRIKEGELLYGVLKSVTTFGSLIGVSALAYITHRKSVGVSRSLLLGVVLQSLALAMLGFPVLAVLSVSVFILGLGGELLNVSFDSIMQKYVPLERLGTIRGIFDVVATLIIPISQILVAWLIEGGAPQEVLSLSLGALAIASGLWIYRVIRIFNISTY